MKNLLVMLMLSSFVLAGCCDVKQRNDEAVPDEAHAVTMLRTIVAAQTAYFAANGTYTGSFKKLRGTNSKNSFLAVHPTTSVEGYKFFMTSARKDDKGNNTYFVVRAKPLKAGYDTYYADASGVVRLNDEKGEVIAESGVSIQGE